MWCQYAAADEIEKSALTKVSDAKKCSEIEDLFKDSSTVTSLDIGIKEDNKDIKDDIIKPQKDLKNDIMSLFEKVHHF